MTATHFKTAISEVLKSVFTKRHVFWNIHPRRLVNSSDVSNDLTACIFKGKLPYPVNEGTKIPRNVGDYVSSQKN